MSTPTAAEVARLEKLRNQLSSDIEVMHQKEASLREYEQKLRVLVEQSGHSQSPMSLTQKLSAHPLSAHPLSTSPMTAHPMTAHPMTAHPMTSHSVTSHPLSDQAMLEREWDKYQRANALLEAARRALTDDRLAMREREQRVMIREQEVARREAWLKDRELKLTARIEADAVAAATPKQKHSLTMAPFMAAKQLLSLGKSDPR